MSEAEVNMMEQLMASTPADWGLDEKPLFVPLKGTHYDKFSDGSKWWEYRKLGKRWNESTIYIGRPVILSRGYGKQHRMNRTILEVKIIDNPAELPGWTDCYGDDPGPCIAFKVR